MDLNKYPTPHPQVAARIVDDQAVIVLADSGEVNVLNPVATRIWDLIDGTNRVQDIANIIVSEYDVTPESALEDVQAFLQQLAEANALLLLDQPLRPTQVNL